MKVMLFFPILQDDVVEFQFLNTDWGGIVFWFLSLKKLTMIGLTTSGPFKVLKDECYKEI